MSTVREVACNIHIVGTVYASLVFVSRWNDPSFDRSIIGRRADLWLSRTSTPCENHRSNCIQVTSQSESNFEIAAVHLLSGV
jgi:hypothetical protein